MNRNETITGFLLAHAGKDPVSFHMPGHKGAEVFRRLGYGPVLDRLADMDITEIPGADNLFQTEGIIAQTMERYRALYGSRKSYLLINGSSCGLIAAGMSSALRRKDLSKPNRLIMARNCHKSIFNAVELTGSEPVYAYPEVVPEYGITGAVPVSEIRRCLAEAPDATAVILPSPNYYGICSEIREIAGVCHEAGVVLIVDEAHGAHLSLMGTERADALAAGKNGADIVINSTHKTLCSFTQTAVANIYGDGIDLDAFEDALQKIESTSPSYVLMTSLDLNADILERFGKELMKDWRKELDTFYEKASRIPGLTVLQHPLLDDSKLDFSVCGMTGAELEDALMKREIYPELTTGDLCMCMTGIGNTHEHYQRLLAALVEIAESTETTATEESPLDAEVLWNMRGLERRALSPHKKRVPLTEAAGQVCARALIPYPPGIPAVCPGEVIPQEVVTAVAAMRARGENVMGVDADGTVLVGMD